MSKLVGNYQLVSKLGIGSYASVYKGIDVKTGQEYAVKAISKEKLGADEKLHDNLESEINIMREYSHKNVVRLFENFVSNRHIYLVLEYCKGGDLAKFIKKNGRLSDRISKRFLKQLAAGLAFLHSQNLIHRDIKPQNLLLSESSEHAAIKIADFGFAKHLSESSMAKTACGTPLYMAPEIFEMHEYDAKADLWSVGCVFFEMLTGSPPFKGSNPRELFLNIRSKQLRLPSDVSFSQETHVLLQKLLERDPRYRCSLEDFHSLCSAIAEPDEMPPNAAIAPPPSRATGAESSSGIYRENRNPSVTQLGNRINEVNRNEDSGRGDAKEPMQSKDEYTASPIPISAGDAFAAPVGKSAEDGTGTGSSQSMNMNAGGGRPSVGVLQPSPPPPPQQSRHTGSGSPNANNSVRPSNATPSTGLSPSTATMLQGLLGAGVATTVDYFTGYGAGGLPSHTSSPTSSSKGQANQPLAGHHVSRSPHGAPNDGIANSPTQSPAMSSPIPINMGGVAGREAQRSNSGDGIRSPQFPPRPRVSPNTLSPNMPSNTAGQQAHSPFYASSPVTQAVKMSPYGDMATDVTVATLHANATHPPVVGLDRARSNGDDEADDFVLVKSSPTTSHSNMMAQDPQLLQSSALASNVYNAAGHESSGSVARRGSTGSAPVDHAITMANTANQLKDMESFAALYEAEFSYVGELLRKSSSTYPSILSCIQLGDELVASAIKEQQQLQYAQMRVQSGGAERARADSGDGSAPALVSQAMSLYLHAVTLVNRLLIHPAREVSNVLQADNVTCKSTMEKLLKTYGERVEELLLRTRHCLNCTIENIPSVCKDDTSFQAEWLNEPPRQSKLPLLLSTNDVWPVAESVLYRHCMQIARKASVAELLGNLTSACSMYSSARSMLACIMLTAAANQEDMKVLLQYDTLFADQLSNCAKIAASISGDLEIPR